MYFPLMQVCIVVVVVIVNIMVVIRSILYRLLSKEYYLCMAWSDYGMYSHILAKKEKQILPLWSIFTPDFLKQYHYIHVSTYLLYLSSPLSWHCITFYLRLAAIGIFFENHYLSNGWSITPSLITSFQMLSYTLIALIFSVLMLASPWLLY